MQELLTKQNLKDLPPLYANDGNKPDEIKVPVKFFNPIGGQTWYVTEYDEKDTLYGYTVGLGSNEYGYASLSEIKAIKLDFGLSIERDINWNPNTTMQEVLDKHQ